MLASGKARHMRPGVCWQLELSNGRPIEPGLLLGLFCRLFSPLFVLCDPDTHVDMQEECVSGLACFISELRARAPVKAALLSLPSLTTVAVSRNSAQQPSRPSLRSAIFATSTPSIPLYIHTHTITRMLCGLPAVVVALSSPNLKRPIGL